MNKKIVVQFLVLTFLIRILFGGGVVVCEQFGFLLNEQPLLYLPFLISAWSPAIASLIVLKKNSEVSSIKEWLKNIFNVRTAACNYFLVAGLLIVYMVSMVATSGLKHVNPFYMFFILAFGSLVAGAGMEEAGWRYILQAELNKKFGYLLACLIIAPIHIVWHIPLGIGASFLWNVINIVGITFALGAIHKISRGNIFLCVVFHCAINAGMSTIVPYQTIPGVTVTAIVMVAVSITAVLIHQYTQKSRVDTK